MKQTRVHDTIVGLGTSVSEDDFIVLADRIVGQITITESSSVPFLPFHLLYRVNYYRKFSAKEGHAIQYQFCNVYCSTAPYFVKLVL